LADFSRLLYCLRNVLLKVRKSTIAAENEQNMLFLFNVSNLVDGILGNRMEGNDCRQRLSEQSLLYHSNLISCALCWVQEVKQLFSVSVFCLMSGIIFTFVTKKWQYKQFFLSQQHLSILEKKTLFLKCWPVWSRKSVVFWECAQLFWCFYTCWA
jgi:hypothetical protein